MRSLLAKDLLILRRSRLLLALLVIYPAAIALLIGLAISRSPARPRVAVLDQTPPGETVSVGGRLVPVKRYARELFSQVQPVSVSSRAQAISEVTSADVLAAVVIPADIAARLSSATTQAGLEVIYNGDALEQSLVQSQLGSALAQANLGFSRQIQQAAARAIDRLLRGGSLGALGAPENLIGLRAIPSVLHRILSHQPPGADRAALQRVASFADFAAANLSASTRVLSTIGEPIALRTRLLHGRRTPLNTFAVVLAVTVSEMFVCVLLAAGGLALEREENALGRLLRGLVTRPVLLGEKALLAAGCSLALALALLCGVSLFVPLHWGRAGLWLLALAFGSVAFASLGLAIGALAREVRSATLLSFLLSLPLAFLALVPAGSISRGLFDTIGAVSYVFPFKASLQALDAAVNGASPAIGVSLAHLLGLSGVFGALAWAGLRRVD